MNRTHRILNQKFAAEPRWKAPEGYGIVTSTDKTFFQIFQVMYYSVQLKADIPMELYDLGMSSKQIEWCKSQPFIEIKRLDSNLIVDSNVEHWENWNKPVMMLNTKFERFVWMDADCVVHGNIEELFDLYDDHCVIFGCELGWEGASNLHSKLGSNLSAHQSGPPFINNGVLVLDKKIDKELLEDWASDTQEVIRSPKMNLNQVHCWDQGIMQWTLEKKCWLGNVQKETVWNKFTHYPEKSKTLRQFLAFKNDDENNTCNLYHYCGPSKYNRDGSMRWSSWGEVPINDVNVKEMEFDYANTFYFYLPEGQPIRRPNFSSRTGQDSELDIWLNDPPENTSYFGVFKNFNFAKEGYGQEFLWEDLIAQAAPKTVLCLRPMPGRHLKDIMHRNRGLQDRLYAVMNEIEFSLQRQLDEDSLACEGMDYCIDRQMHADLSYWVRKIIKANELHNGLYTDFHLDARRSSRLEMLIRTFCGMYLSTNPELELKLPEKYKLSKNKHLDKWEVSSPNGMTFGYFDNKEDGYEYAITVLGIA